MAKAKQQEAAAPPAQSPAPAPTAPVRPVRGSGGLAPHTNRTHDCPRCTYFDRLGESAPDAQGIWRGLCRRYAPRAGLLGPEEFKFASWPQVHSGDWCGEYVQADD